MSARYLTDREIRSRDPHPQSGIQFCLVIQVKDDIPQARITDPIRAREMQSSDWGTWFVTTVIDIAVLNGQLHRTMCHNNFG